MATVHAHSSLERASQIALVLAHHELWSLVEVLGQMLSTRDDLLPPVLSVE